MKEGREYRTFDCTFKAIENEQDSGDCWVEGYATVVDRAYDFGYNGMKEMIRKSAFDNADMSDVIFQYDHEGLVMARLRNKTLEINIDDHGMHIRANLRGCEKGRQLYEAIRNGLVDRMSWGFIVADDGWEYDQQARTAIINKVLKVFDVSAVSLPACEVTSISARSYLNGVIEAEKRRSCVDEKKQVMKKLAASLELF